MDIGQEFKELTCKYLNNYYCKKDFYTGWIDGPENYKKFQECLLDLGISFIIRTSCDKKEDWITNRARLVYQSQHGVAVPYSGIPFFVQKNIQMQCRLGPKRKVAHISKSDPGLSNEEEIHSYSNCNRQRSQVDTKKMGCPAYMSVKVVKHFYTYAVGTNEDLCTSKVLRIKKKQCLEKLLADLETENPPFSLRFYVEVSTIEVHNHDFGVSQQVGARIHPKIAKKIEELVRSGVASSSDVKHHLELFTNVLLKDHSIRPNESNTTYFPSDHVIRTHIYNAKKNMCKGDEQFISVESEAAEQCNEERKNQPIANVRVEKEKRQLCDQLRELLEQTRHLTYLLQDEGMIRKGINLLQHYRDEILECLPQHDGSIVVKLVELPMEISN
ncbi:hypothetical protein CHUAL_013839 [Chamberlinius hualienensis]